MQAKLLDDLLLRIPTCNFRILFVLQEEITFIISVQVYVFNLIICEGTKLTNKDIKQTIASVEYYKWRIKRKYYILFVGCGLCYGMVGRIPF